MTDRELLELAAKVVGKTIDWRDTFDAQSQEYLTLSYGWNPLTDDGDALRLAVKLGLDVRNALYTDAVFVDCFEINPIEVAYGGDPYAATRRAIVRAAAEIGKSL